MTQTVEAARYYPDSIQTNILRVNLKHQKPNTTYYYKCGSDNGEWSETCSCKTAPVNGSKEKFILGVWGDTQDNEFNTQFDKTAIIVDELKKHPVQYSYG